MNQTILAVTNDSMELPAGLIESPQDLMRLLGVSQATAYRVLKSIKDNPEYTINGLKFEAVDMEEEA